MEYIAESNDQEKHRLSEQSLVYIFKKSLLSPLAD